MKTRGLLIVLVCGATALNAAEWREARAFDGAVFQADKPIRVSLGKIRHRGGEVSVSFNGQTLKAAVRDQTFAVEFPPMPYGGPHEMTLSHSGGETFTALDIHIGEVWYCVGQSNMMFPMTKLHAEATWKVAEGDSYPLVRTPGSDGWKRATDIATIKNFAGTAYYFARELHKELGVAVGFKAVGAGGTSLWQWTPDELHQTPELKALHQIMERRNAIAADRFPKKQLTDDSYPRAASFSTYRYPWFPIKFGDMAELEDWLPRAASGAARGMVFWQGESDIGLSTNYEPLFRGMLRRWRAKAGYDFPFILIQLPTYGDGPGKDSKLDGIIGTREAQRRVAMTEPNTEMVVSYDIYGVKADIHPSNKQGYGKRLAQVVLGSVYGKPIPWRSPRFVEASFEGGNAMVRFDRSEGGLRARAGGKNIQGFQLAGSDQVFHPAEATVNGTDAVTLRSAKVSKPVAVRYAWDKNPVADLVGEGGMPASPFRSDDWPLWPLPAEAR